MIAKTYVYAPDQISGIDMPEETLAIIYFEITDPTYMEIYEKKYLGFFIIDFKIKGSFKNEYEKYARKDDTYDTYLTYRKEGYDGAFFHHDRELYYICSNFSPMIDKTKEYIVYLKIDVETEEIVLNKSE